MMRKLQEFSSRKILNEVEFLPKPIIDFKYESIVNPVPENWRWCFKRGQGNIINVCNGYVIVKDGWGCVVKKRRFTSRYERNNIVNSYEKLYHGGKRIYYICVEFD